MFDGFEELGEQFKEMAANAEVAIDEVDEKLDTAAEATAKDVAVDAARRAPRRTGRLAASIDYVQLGLARYRIGSNLDYAPHVEYGTNPHIIEAEDGVLAFQAGGSTVFRESVEHPGTEAQPYLRPALAGVESTFLRRIRRESIPLFQAIFEVSD